MADYVKRAKEKLSDIMKEFEPAKGHAVGAGREFLLALRSVVDAEIKLYDRATAKKEKREPCSGAAAETPEKPEPPEEV